jgi:hypothetical protein
MGSSNRFWRTCCNCEPKTWCRCSRRPYERFIPFARAYECRRCGHRILRFKLPFGGPISAPREARPHSLSILPSMPYVPAKERERRELPGIVNGGSRSAEMPNGSGQTQAPHQISVRTAGERTPIIAKRVLGRVRSPLSAAGNRPPRWPGTAAIPLSVIAAAAVGFWKWHSGHRPIRTAQARREP